MAANLLKYGMNTTQVCGTSHLGRKSRKQLTKISAAAEPNSQDGSENLTNKKSTIENSIALLERFSELSESGSESDHSLTIREQLEIRAKELGANEFEHTFTLAQLQNRKATRPLTIHQKRNIRRQSYLNKVSTRNDAPLFANLLLLLLLPPAGILAFAVAGGIVDLSALFE